MAMMARGQFAQIMNHPFNFKNRLHLQHKSSILFSDQKLPVCLFMVQGSQGHSGLQSLPHIIVWEGIWNQTGETLGTLPCFPHACPLELRLAAAYCDSIPATASHIWAGCLGAQPIRVYTVPDHSRGSQQCAWMDLLSSLPDVDSTKSTKYTNADTHTLISNSKMQPALEGGVCACVRACYKKTQNCVRMCEHASFNTISALSAFFLVRRCYCFTGGWQFSCVMQVFVTLLWSLWVIQVYKTAYLPCYFFFIYFLFLKKKSSVTTNHVFPLRIYLLCDSNINRSGQIC